MELGDFVVSKIKNKNHKQSFFYMLMIIATMFMSVGYASINSITATISGNLMAEVQEGVFIRNVTYTPSSTEGTTSQKINYYVETLLDTEITLDSNTNSTITYEVSIYNNSNKDYVFIGAIADTTDSNSYSNTNIEYILNNITEYSTVITPKDTITFTITFKYKGTDVSNNTLKSKINFRFEEIPTLKLNNTGETYTLNNIYPDYEPQEYQFTVSNYNAESINNVPMTYSFETSIDNPLSAKIYDYLGNEVTGSIDINGNGTEQIEHTYTLKIFWDDSNTTENIAYNSSEYAAKEYNCNVSLIATPTNVDYLDYKINEKFEVDIISASLNFNIDIETSIGMEKEAATLPILITNYDSNNEYNNYNIDYEISITGNDKFTYSINDEIATTFTRVLQGTQSVTDSFNILFNADIHSLLESETATVTIKLTAPYTKEITLPVTINLQKLDVRFDANGGTVTPTSLTTYKGMTYGTLPTPTWTGHTFEGWFTAAEGGTQITETTEVTLGNLTQTLYAQWTSRLLSDKVAPGDLVNYNVGYSNVAITYIRTSATYTLNIESGYTGWKVLDVVGTGDDKYVLLISSGIPLSFVCPRLTTDTTNGQKCQTALTTDFFSTSINSTLTNYKFYKNGFTGVTTIAGLKNVFLNNKYTKLDTDGNPIVRASTKEDIDGSLAMTAEINGTEAEVIANLTDFTNNTLFGLPSTSTTYDYMPWYIATAYETYYLWNSYLSGYVVYTADTSALGVRPVVALKATTETTGKSNNVWQLSTVS